MGDFTEGFTVAVSRGTGLTCVGFTEGATGSLPEGAAVVTGTGTTAMEEAVGIAEIKASGTGADTEGPASGAVVLGSADAAPAIGSTIAAARQRSPPTPATTRSAAASAATATGARFERGSAWPVCPSTLV